jgi:hypothetical protein
VPNRNADNLSNRLPDNLPDTSADDEFADRVTHTGTDDRSRIRVSKHIWYLVLQLCE